VSEVGCHPRGGIDRESGRGVHQVDEGLEGVEAR